MMCFGGAAFAETFTWTSPEVIPDNPVLTLMQSRWSVDGQQVVVAGAYMSFDERAYMEVGLHPGGDVFWQAVKDLDTASLISAAKPVDNVGLSYFVPFILSFPTQRLRTLSLEHPELTIEDTALLQRLNHQHAILVTREYEFSQGATLETVLLVFRLDEDRNEQPGKCHAQQVIRAIYTGAVDNEELLDCRAAQ